MGTEPFVRLVSDADAPPAVTFFSKVSLLHAAAPSTVPNLKPCSAAPSPASASLPVVSAPGVWNIWVTTSLKLNDSVRF
jgi:hypothetical protein